MSAPHRLLDTLDSGVPPESSSLVMSEADALALGRRIVAFASNDQTTAVVTHSVSGVTRIANGQVLSGDDGESLQISVDVQIGKRPGVRLLTNQRDDASLRALVTTAEAMVRQQAGNESDPEATLIGPQTYDPVHLWYQASMDAIDTARHEVVPRIITAVRAAGLEGAGFVGGLARTRAVVRKSGLAVACRETDFECTVTARAVDGTSSGWAGRAARDWACLDPDDVARRAIAMSRLAANPVAIEPGRRTAILGPAAVAQLVRAMAYAYDSTETAMGGTPFSDQNAPSQSKVGQRVFDSRLRIVSDAADPAGGFVPFYPDQGGAGIPLRPVTWVDGGVLRMLAYPVGLAVFKGTRHSGIPLAVRLEAMPNVATGRLESMIAGCREGIYVNRFSGLTTMDRKVGLMSGVTRDGCFLVKDGKIEKSVKNFRFRESPFHAFNRIESIGMPERASLGYVKTAPYDMISFQAYSWPLEPIIVPPLVIRDFNFATLSDAV